MADRDNLVTVIDGDTLSQGYFNDLVLGFVEDTDTSGSDHTQATATFTLKRTFTITGLLATDVLQSFDFDGFLTTSDSTACRIAIEIDDGTNFWSPFGNNANDALTARWIIDWREDTSSSPQAWISNADNTANRMNTTAPVPNNMVTGATAYTVKIYLANAGSGTATLTKGFTIRLNFRRRIVAIGSSSDA